MCGVGRLDLDLLLAFNHVVRRDCIGPIISGVAGASDAECGSDRVSLAAEVPDESERSESEFWIERHFVLSYLIGESSWELAPPRWLL